jgi:cyclophilin family peptidyl-prolyl cis-trans isomerase
MIRTAIPRALVAALLLCAVGALGVLDARAAAGQTVTLETTKGNIVVELYPDEAPKTVANFLAYVQSGHYDGTIFHRVISGFMIQGGGLTSDLAKKSTREPIENESDNGLSNTRGTIAMARTPAPHSATAQFFINTVDNKALDHGGVANGWGYAVFGKVTEGMDVADAVAAVKTTTKQSPEGSEMSDVPLEPVVIQKARAN